MTPANDNTPPLGRMLPIDPSEIYPIPDVPLLRQAILRAREGQPEPVSVLAWPTLERYGRSNPAAVQTLLEWRNLIAPMAPIAANDNEVLGGGGFGVDRNLEIRPTVEELIAASAEPPPLTFTERGTQLGSLLFRKGKLIEWGRTKRGQARLPDETLRGVKGKRALVCSGEDDGSLAGKTRPSSTARAADAGQHAASEEMARHLDEKILRRQLGDHAQILDAACGDSTAREIGELRGHIGKTAERQGIRLVDQALAALRELLDEDKTEKAA